MPKTDWLHYAENSLALLRRKPNGSIAPKDDKWVAHHRLALKAGLDPAVADDLAQGKRPGGMQEGETAIYDFSHELHNQHAVSDATFKAALDLFGEQGVVDLIAANGYYTLVSMILNVDRAPVPGGGKPPLPPL